MKQYLWNEVIESVIVPLTSNKIFTNPFFFRFINKILCFYSWAVLILVSRWPYFVVNVAMLPDNGGFTVYCVFT
jgi:hypothetical protein